MSKFQIGDRVRVVENSKYHGVVSTIDGVIDGGRFFTIDGYSPNFQEEDLEVAKQPTTTSKFKVGDRVWHDVRREDMVITSSHSDPGYWCVTRKDGVCGSVHESHLVKVDETEPVDEQNHPTSADVIAIMNGFTDEQRMEVMGEFCHYCGDKNPRCQCWNDE